MAIKIKGTPSSVRNLLSGTGGGTGAQVNGGAPGSRESRNKVKVDQSPSTVPRRTSAGARLQKSVRVSQPSSFGQPFNV